MRRKADFVKTVDKKDTSKEDHLRTLYYDAVEKYHQKKMWAHKDLLKGRSLALWSRVRQKQEESGVSPEDFIKAQFVWYKKNFGRAPTVVQLATENAVIRAKEFGGFKGNVVASAVEHKTSLAETFRLAEKSLQKICREQKMTREEVYRNLVIPGIITFPEKFLLADPVYKKVTDESD